MDLQETLKELVRIPSPAGSDPRAILQATQAILSDEGIDSTLLFKGTRPVALLAEAGQGELTYCLNAPLDTAPIGDLEAWNYPPYEAYTDAGWLYGRGSADAKAGVAVFLKLFIGLSRTQLKGKLQILLDADEHTGNFEGASAYLALGHRPQGLIIGYPGYEEICRGARGVYRVSFEVFGTGQHSGKIAESPNAIKRANQLAELLEMRDFKIDPDFPHPPQVSLVGLRGGEGFSVTPSRAELELDIRLTPSWNLEAARDHIQEVINHFDQNSPSPTKVVEHLAWPAYQLSEEALLVKELEAITAKTSKVSAYSNLGCLFSKHQIPTLCGYGVECRNLHGPDEAISLETLKPVYEDYRLLLVKLLGL